MAWDLGEIMRGWDVQEAGRGAQEQSPRTAVASAGASAGARSATARNR